MVEPTPPRWFRVEHNADEEGRRIIVHIFHAPNEKRRYMGQMDLMRRTPLGLERAVYNFEIEAESLDEAKNTYDEARQAEIDKLKAPKIVVPDPEAGPGREP